MLLTKRNILKTVSAVGFFAVLGTIFAEIDVSKFKSPKEFLGVVKSLSSTVVRMGLDYNNYKGNVNFVVPPGTKFSGPVLDLKGNVIVPGDILITMDTAVCDALVDQAKADLDTKKSNYKRCQRIIAKGGRGAISDQKLLEAKNDYLKAKAELILAKARLDTCTYNAQFDGIVDEVLFPGGYTTLSDREVMKVSQLVPIGVEIEITREEAYKYGIQTPIAIFPVGHKEPVGPYRGGTIVTNNKDEMTLKFIVSNFRDLNRTKKLKTGQVVPVVRNISPVVLFDANSNGDILSVYENSIMKDEKGTYVMSVEGQNITNAINPIFKLNKIYVTTANVVTQIETSIKYVKLQDAGGLVVNDTLLTNKDCRDLKDGDIVYYEKTRYMFMPGDPVKVVFDTAVTNESRGLKPGKY